jgi:tetratricopeptide (TPR) repeat protein
MMMSEKSEKLVAKGEKLFGQGKYHKALKAFKEALTFDPEDIVALNNKGVVLEEFNQLEEALACYEEAIRINKDFNLAWTNRGYVLVQQGKFKEAIKCYRRALKIEPQDQIAKERLKQAVKLVSELGEEVA